MGRCTRLRVVCAFAGACLTLVGAAPAHATFVYSDLTSFNLNGSFSSYGGGTQYHISTTGDGSVSYRWLDVTPQDNIISGNSCSDLSEFGSWYYNSGVTVYRQLFSASAGLCFIVRGKTAGGGYMLGYSGRLQR